MKNDDVYAIGANTCGCLGLGHLLSTLIPQKVHLLCKKGIKGFAFGNGPHAIAFTSTGEVFSWGHNGNYELGTGTTLHSASPNLIGCSLTDKVVMEVACGAHHSVVLTNDGEVYAWGQYKNGQMISCINQNQLLPKKVQSTIAGKIIVGIACGQSHTMAITNKGEVYGWGFNIVGQLGLGNTMNQLNPCRIMALSNTVIVKIVCGNSHTLALSDEGKVYAWGANTYGQLASNSKNNVLTPEQIPENIGRIIDIAANHYSHISAAITETSRVYMWGQCRGQSVFDPILTPFSTLHEVFASYSSPPVTYQPVPIVSDFGVEDSIRAAFDDRGTSDLTIRVEGKDIYVHKAVLKIRCQHFRSMFQDHWEEDKKDVLEITQFSYPVYKAFLQYLYTDQVDLLQEQALGLLVLANAYCEDSLKKLCEEVIRQGIDIENAAELYSNAITFQAKELEDFCFNFALIHMTQVVLSKGFSSLDEVTVKNFIARAAEAGAFKT
ncbi:RCC1 and BTB domain-containing protein 1-like isoform X2 [Cimex lectularius]|nr:RCC1 and BTB domain-containing protein 1-like isoform X2 [Cimex lectularius]XP_014258904.1 RCC1 and BTB domain-containing protein 1-like isoform X2 [Cimex lectularius]